MHVFEFTAELGFGVCSRGIAPSRCSSSLVFVIFLFSAVALFLVARLQSSSQLRALKVPSPKESVHPERSLEWVAHGENDMAFKLGR